MNHALQAGLVLCLLGTLGCGKKEADTPKPAAAPPATSSPPPAPSPATPPASPAATSPVVSGAQGTASAHAGAPPAKALATALEAANRAPKAGTPCEQAFSSMKAVVDSMKKHMLPAQAAETESKLPTQEKFLAGCAALPPPLQKCLNIAYAMSNRDECRDAQAKLDPATAAKIKAMMGK